MMRLIELAEQLADQFEDISYTENQLVIAMPRMVRTTSPEELRETFETHLYETRRHVARLGRLFRHLAIPRCAPQSAPASLLCDAGDSVAESSSDLQILDAAAQRIEHFEKVAQRCIRRFTEFLADDRF